MYFLILGSVKDIHAARIKNTLTQRGFRAEYLDTSLFPSQISISWQPRDGDGWIVLENGIKLNFKEIKSIFWRSFNNVGIPNLKDSYQRNLAYNDAMSTIRTFMQGTEINWINSWQAYQFHKEKPLQLSKVKSIGVNIPDTLITNEQASVLEFYRQRSQVIFKPVYGGAHAKFLNQDYLTEERLKLALKTAPITLQEYIPGTNIRTYCLGKKIYSAEIRSNSLDFRQDINARLIPLELPAEIEEQSFKIAAALGLKWTAIDWRLTPAGEYFFLEANPSPMFIHFEQQTNYPITSAIIDLLTL